MVNKDSSLNQANNDLFKSRRVVITKAVSALKSDWFLKAIRRHAIMASMAVLVIGLLVAAGGRQLTESAHQTIAAKKPITQSEQAALKSQVDTSTGQPQSGRDPSRQPQSSLQAAASSQHGNGMQNSKPASDITGSNRPATKASDVYGDPSKTGINDAGCYIDYGIQGQQCLAADMAANGKMSCDMVHMDFPDGISVVGTDRLGLDLNKDGTACGKGD